MAAPLYTQYIFPAIPAQSKGYVHEIRINRGPNYPYFYQSSSFTLDPSVRCLPDKAIGKLKRALSNAEGIMTTDGVEINLIDPYAYSGKEANGTPQSEDLMDSQQSLLWKIFESIPTDTIRGGPLIYRLWLTKRRRLTRGVYSNVATYNPGDIVADATNNMPFKNILTCTGQAPSIANSTYWVRAYNIYFSGSFVADDISFPGVQVVKPATTNELIRRVAQFKVKSGTNDLQNVQVGDLIGAAGFSAAAAGYTAPNGTGTMTNKPFYLGLSEKEGVHWVGEDETQHVNRADKDNGDWTSCAKGTSPEGLPATNFFEISGYGRYDSSAYEDSSLVGPSHYDNVFPHGTWGIGFAELWGYICRCAGFDAGITTSAFYQHIHNAWDGTKNGYSTTEFANLTALHVCYNYLFGITPANSLNGVTIAAPFPASAEFANPYGFSWKTPLSEVVKQFCWDYGSRVFYRIDQADGDTIADFVSRRTTQGTIPTNWTPKGKPKKEVITSRKEYIEVKTKGADGSLFCPPKRGDAAQGITVTLGQRARQMGTLNPATGNTVGYQYNDLIINSKFGANGQDAVVRREDTGATTRVHADGWVCGAHAFFLVAGPLGLTYFPSGGSAFPSNAALLSHGTGPNTDWSGYYPVAVCTEKSGVTVNRNDWQYGPAQFWARELLIDERPWTREYKGLADNNGDIDTILPNLIATWPAPDFVTGAINTAAQFRAIEIEIDILPETVVAKFTRLPNYTTLADLPTYLDNGSTSSASGSSSSSTAGNGSLSVTTAVLTNPGTATQNVILPTSDVLGLNHKRFSVGTTQDFEDWTDQTGAVLSKVTNDGKFHTPATVGGDTSDTLTTKGYVIGLIPTVPTDNVKTDPSTTPQNTILPQNSTTVPLTLKSYGSGTVDLLAIQDNSGNPLIEVTSAGREVHTGHGMDINHGFEIGLNLTTTHDQNSLLITTSATSADIMDITNAGTNVFNFTAKNKLTLNGGATNSGSFLHVNGSIGSVVKNVTAIYVILETDSVITADATSGAFSTLLPTASGHIGREYTIIRTNAGANSVTVTTSGVETLNGLASKVLTAQYQEITVRAVTSSSWIIT